MQSSDLFRLDGKVAIVTGGTSRYGAPIVRALAGVGATVIFTSRDADKCKEAAQRLRREGLKAHGETLDLRSETGIRAVRDRIMGKYERVDVLFNNAVERAGAELRQTTAVEWETSAKVNSTGLFLACQIFSEPMQVQRSGSIINIASIYGMVGPDFSIYEGTNMTNLISYAFEKGGMISLTRYLASSLGPYGVRVNCLSPGGFETEGMPEDFKRRYRLRTPLGRMACEDDIKGPAIFLASDASRYVTGQNIPVDGGWTAI